MSEDYKIIVEHYESCLEKHGDNHFGCNWPNLEDLHIRFSIMLDILNFSPRKKNKYSLLDFGCGTGLMLEYLHDNKINLFKYSGCDLSKKFISVCETKYPKKKFIHLDIIKERDKLNKFDFIVMNGVLTEKHILSFDDMWKYAQLLIKLVFEKAKIGLAFNVMSKHVQWERNDLFHLPFDMLANFLDRDVTRNYIFRSDYGLYEYTAYIYK